MWSSPPDETILKTACWALLYIRRMKEVEVENSRTIPSLELGNMVPKDPLCLLALLKVHRVE